MAEAVRRRLIADDGSLIAATHHSGPVGAPVVVLAHGFTGSEARPEVQTIVEHLRRRLAVIAVDLRGHGRSGGWSTLGHREVADVQAAVRWGRLLGYQRVASLGFSMGGAVVVRHAAEYGGVDAVASVSAPARWNYRGTKPMRTAHWVVSGRVRRALLSRTRGTRVDMQVWETQPWPADPRTAAAALRMPLLVVHGDSDHYFPVDHGEQLAAGPSAVLWLEPGFAHAESGIGPELLDRIIEWLANLGGTLPQQLP